MIRAAQEMSVLSFVFTDVARLLSRPSHIGAIFLLMTLRGCPVIFFFFCCRCMLPILANERCFMFLLDVEHAVPCEPLRSSTFLESDNSAASDPQANLQANFSAVFSSNTMQQSPHESPQRCDKKTSKPTFGAATIRQRPAMHLPIEDGQELYVCLLQMVARVANGGSRCC
jgi:hypothetical protein